MNWRIFMESVRWELSRVRAGAEGNRLWRKVLMSSGWILGLTLALILLFWLDIHDLPFRGSIYNKLFNDSNTINTVAAIGFFDVFNKLFFAIAVLIIGLAHSGNIIKFIPVDEDNPIHRVLREHSGKPYIISFTGLPPVKEVLLVSLTCWLLSLPLSLFLWNVAFFHHTQFWVSASILGYILSVVLSFLLIMSNRNEFKNTRTTNLRNPNLTGFDTQLVMQIMGIPIQIFEVEAKVIYVYENVKVIFTDGKVSDVQ